MAACSIRTGARAICRLAVAGSVAMFAGLLIAAPAADAAATHRMPVGQSAHQQVGESQHLGSAKPAAAKPAAAKRAAAKRAERAKRPAKRAAARRAAAKRAAAKRAAIRKAAATKAAARQAAARRRGAPSARQGLRRRQGGNRPAGRRPEGRQAAGERAGGQPRSHRSAESASAAHLGGGPSAATGGGGSRQPGQGCRVGRRPRCGRPSRSARRCPPMPPPASAAPHVRQLPRRPRSSRPGLPESPAPHRPVRQSTGNWRRQVIGRPRSRFRSSSPRPGSRSAPVRWCCSVPSWSAGWPPSSPAPAGDGREPAPNSVRPTPSCALRAASARLAGPVRCCAVGVARPPSGSAARARPGRSRPAGPAAAVRA